MKLDNIVEKLVQNRSYTQCFIKGALVDLPQENFIGKISVTPETLWEGCSGVMKRISEVIMEKKTVLMDLAKNRIFQRDYEVEKDIDFCSETFAYYSRLASKLKVDIDKICSILNRGYHGIILEDCPIFTTLSLLIAAPIASGKSSVCLFVNSKYSVISVCFAAILIEAGLPSGIVNVVPYFDKKSLSLIVPCSLQIIGVIPPEVPKGEFHFSKVISKRNSPCPIIVLKTADVDSVIDSIVACTRSNEVFWFPNVIYVEEPCYEKFVQCLDFATKNRIASYNLNERNSEVDQLFEKFIREKKDYGVKVVELIHRFLKCVFLINDDAALNLSTFCDEEKSTCHRVISVIPIRTTQEAVSFANSSTGGLAVSLWTNDALEITSLSYKLKYGTVWVNSFNQYSPAVPFAPWGSFGYGAFTGKRGLFENFINLKNNYDIQVDHYPYCSDENVTFSKKDISSVIKQSLSAFVTWHKLADSSKSSFLYNVSMMMEDIWQTRLKTILSENFYQTWKMAGNYMKFWASYSVDNTYQQSFHENGFQIVSRSEPLGVIAILADQRPVDDLIFVISAGLTFGNTVVVGISKDDKCSNFASELENLFKTQPGLVNVVVDTDEDLWNQFTSNSDISSVWVSGNSHKFNVNNPTFKNIVQSVVTTELAEMYEIYATKQRSVWLPTLC